MTQLGQKINDPRPPSCRSFPQGDENHWGPHFLALGQRGSKRARLPRFQHELRVSLAGELGKHRQLVAQLRNRHRFPPLPQTSVGRNGNREDAATPARRDTLCSRRSPPSYRHLSPPPCFRGSAAARTEVSEGGSLSPAPSKPCPYARLAEDPGNFRDAARH